MQANGGKQLEDLRHAGIPGFRGSIGSKRRTIQRKNSEPVAVAWTPRDASGAFLDGGNNYRLRIPPNIPVKNFWSIVAYDADSRSILRNNSDGAIVVYFGLDAPVGRERNWVQTMPGKGWFVLFRFYGPLEPFFDKTWKPDDIEQVR